MFQQKGKTGVNHFGCEIKKSIDTGDIGLYWWQEEKGRDIWVAQAFFGCSKKHVVSKEEEDEWDKMKVRTFTWLLKDVIKGEGTVSYA